MKNRIVSIMDLSKKKAGLTVLCGVLMLTLGTDFAFAVNAEAQDSTQMIQEKIREEIKTSPDLSFAYGFLPDPQIYAQYSSYGITISDDGKRLLYNGQPVRLFVDEHSEVEAFFADDAGTLDVRVTRNTTGNITGIEAISADKAQEYRSAFFADDIEATAANRQDTAGQNKYGQYSIYGITCSTDGEALSYNGQRVKMLVDLLSDGSFETFWFDEAGTMNLSVIRNTTGTITAIESISAEKAQSYQSVAQEYEQNRLDGLEEKVAKKMEGYN